MVVEFKAKANLKPAATVKDRGKRGQAVIDALRSTAGASQRAATANAAKLRGVDAKSYWLTNVLVVEGASATLSKLATTLAKDPAVSRIRAERSYPLVEPVDPKVAVLAAAGEPEWGVAKIGADKAWDAGILGQGVVVATIDTGVEYTHPALVDHYLGNNGDGSFTHDYHWWDPSGTCPDPEPCDNVAHGTHTMGTILGGDGPGPFTPDIGVAPGAKWIAAKGCEVFDCSESSLLSSGQWVLAPTDLNGENPDPSQMPDIVNNSWGGGPGDPFYLETVQAWRAAGIIPVFSSGNPGPFCGEGGSPGDFLEAFSVGATDSDDVIADFSGRGPSVYGKVNPDVSAPGVDVVSSVPGGGYEAFSGTSMAAPHVAGTMALLLSADSSLRGNFAGVTGPIRSTAVDRLDDSCGGDPDGDPNNVYGDGRIDAAAAAALVATGGTLSGTITDSVTGDPIAGAQVTADNGIRPFSTSTDADGKYEMLLAAGDYNVNAAAFGYFGSVVPSVVIVTDETTDQTVRPRPAAAVHGQRHGHVGRERLTDRGRHGPGGRHARRPGHDQRRRALQPEPADRHVHAQRLGRRLHGDRLGRDHLGRRRRDPGLRPVPQARRLRPRLRADGLRLGRRRRPDRADRRRDRRSPAPAVRVRLLRRELHAGLPHRQRLRELPAARVGLLQPDRDPGLGCAERGDLPAVDGPLHHRRRVHRLRRPSARPRTARSSSSTRDVRVLGVADAPRLRDQALGERHHRPALRQQPGQPG